MHKDRAGESRGRLSADRHPAGEECRNRVVVGNQVDVAVRVNLRALHKRLGDRGSRVDGYGAAERRPFLLKRERTHPEGQHIVNVCLEPDLATGMHDGTRSDPGEGVFDDHVHADANPGCQLPAFRAHAETEGATGDQSLAVRSDVKILVLAPLESLIDLSPSINVGLGIEDIDVDLHCAAHSGLAALALRHTTATGNGAGQQKIHQAQVDRFAAE